MHWNVKDYHSWHRKKCDDEDEEWNKDINNEVRWRMMLGWQQNSDEDEPISPCLMRLLNKAYIHQRAPIPV